MAICLVDKMSKEIPIDSNSVGILNAVTKGLNFDVPDVDFNDDAFKIPDSLADALQQVPDRLTIEMLTERKVDGAGCFDAIMKAMRVHLAEEYNSGRITGAEYTKAYIATMQVSLQQAVAYLLGKDQAYYQALDTQAKALASNIDAYTAKVRLAIAKAQALITKAQYANEVVKLGLMDKQTDQVMAQTELTEAQTKTQEKQTDLVIAQTLTEDKKPAQLEAQTTLIEAQKLTEEKRPDQIIAQTGLTEAQTETQQKQALLISEQTELVTAQTLTEDKKPAQIGAQTELIEAQTETQKQQKLLLVEQTEQAHSQVSDTRLDGSSPVEGYVGNQNALLKQQVQSFKNDHIVKGAKVFADSFATQLSMSTATVDGTGLDAAGINKAITNLQNSIQKSSS